MPFFAATRTGHGSDTGRPAVWVSVTRDEQAQDHICRWAIHVEWTGGWSDLDPTSKRHIQVRISIKILGHQTMLQSMRASYLEYEQHPHEG